MPIAPLSLSQDYWETFEITERDLDFLYNHLLELETPLSTSELISALVNERIRQELANLENRKPQDGAIFLPMGTYETGSRLIFPALKWSKGKVAGIRPGNNPAEGAFDVITVRMEDGSERLFAASLKNHPLNQPLEVNLDDPLLKTDSVLHKYGADLTQALEGKLQANPDLVRIAGSWFPRALLVDVNIGHLNLAEAVLDMAGGGPLTTKAILDQVELPTDVNLKLTEFSFNLALQEDGRFDEVGPAGEVLWFLQRLEPEAVRQVPPRLKYHFAASDRDLLTPAMLDMEASLDDELAPDTPVSHTLQEVTLALTYPHWREGTLPLSSRVSQFFPTAYESPRIQVNLILGEEASRVSGWVVRENGYVYGLHDWYISQNIIPGTLLKIRRGKKPGEVFVKSDKHRPTREWIRTVLVGADGGAVFAVLKQLLYAAIDERMVIAIPDSAGLDKLWEQSAKSRRSLEDVVTTTMRELSKLNTQGHVHAQELYACVNLLRRCPPAPIFTLLASKPQFNHVGDLYYRLNDSSNQEDEQ